MANKKFKLPKTAGACADLLYKTREARLKLQKDVERMESEEQQLKDYFINNLSKDNATGVAGKFARVQIKPKVKPVVEDWDKFCAYVRKNNAFEMLQRRLSEGAIEERWEDKKVVPGVGRFNAKTVSVTKI